MRQVVSRALPKAFGVLGAGALVAGSFLVVPGLIQSAAATGGTAGPPTTTHDVQPTYTSGNVTSCPSGTVTLIPSSTASATYSTGGTYFRATVSSTNEYVSFTTNSSSFTVYVKGGPAYDTYDYTTAAYATDTGLHAPLVGNTKNIPTISHYIVCGQAAVVGAPSIRTHASGPATVGSSIHDTATLGTGRAPTGTITFKVYSTSSCKAAVATFVTAGVSVTGTGAYTSATVTPTTVGTYYWTASYSGDAHNSAATGLCDAATESSTVTATAKASPTLTTTAHSDGSVVPLGTSIHDVATLSGGTGPTGTITFKVYSTSSCKTAVATFVTGGVTVTGTGAYTSAAVTPASAGTYYWTAGYSGDTHNNAATSPCRSADESVVVRTGRTMASPTLTTHASGPVTVGSSIHDTATLATGAAPTGTITFKVYSTSSCKTAVATFVTAGVSVTGTGAYTSATVTPTTVGTYYWTASYSGDAHNSAATSPCGSPTEGSSVTKARPAMTTTATTAGAVVSAGSAIHDVAMLTGGDAPTGTITFHVFKTSCSSPVSSFSTAGVAVTGAGRYPSASFAPATAGTYYWTASYSGDANNHAVSTACGTAAESIIVRASTATTKAPKLSVVKRSTPPSGSTVAVTATVTYTLHLSDSGNAAATGVTVTDAIPTGTTYKPTSASCSGLSGCSVSVSSGTVTWTGITITPGASATISFEVVVSAADANGQVIVNHAVFTNRGTTGCSTATCVTNTVTLTVSHRTSAATTGSTTAPTVTTTPPTSPTSPTRSSAGTTAQASSSLTSGTFPARISEATTVHTGEPWAGSLWAEVGVLLAGLSLLGAGDWLRRRRRPKHAAR